MERPNHPILGLRSTANALDGRYRARRPRHQSRHSPSASTAPAPSTKNVWGVDAGRIAEEVIAHLSGLVGAKVVVTLEIEASIPTGAPEHVVRTVTENSRTLKFSEQGFETE